MGGTAPAAFNPDGAVSREMVATTLYRIAGSPEVEGSLFLNAFRPSPAGRKPSSSSSEPSMRTSTWAPSGMAVKL